MGTTRIGLMGLGRIGRNLFRILYQRDDIQLAAISDIADQKALEYLLRFDTILGPFPEEGDACGCQWRGKGSGRRTHEESRRIQ